MSVLVLVPSVLTALLLYGLANTPARKVGRAEILVTGLLILTCWGCYLAGYFSK